MIVLFLPDMKTQLNWNEEKKRTNPNQIEKIAVEWYTKYFITILQ